MNEILFFLQNKSEQAKPYRNRNRISQSHQKQNPQRTSLAAAGMRIDEASSANAHRADTPTLTDGIVSLRTSTPTVGDGATYLLDSRHGDVVAGNAYMSDDSIDGRVSSILFVWQRTDSAWTSLLANAGTFFALEISRTPTARLIDGLGFCCVWILYMGWRCYGFL